MPNVGMGNQLLTLVSYLAHALLTGRALFIHDSGLQCSDDEWGDVPQSPGSDMSILCDDYWRLRHEGPRADGTARPPLWRLAAVLERSKRPERLARLHAAYPANAANPLGRLHLYFRPNPEHQHALQRFVCAPDVPGRDETRLLAIQTTQYYVPLLQTNPRLAARLRRLFEPIDAPPAGSRAARPFEADLDTFGPLFRFLLRPSAAVEAAVEDFAARHFARAHRVVGVHIRAGIPGADNTWVNAFGRGTAGLGAFERGARKCARAVTLNESAALDADGGPPADADIVAFVASDNAGMRTRMLDSLGRIDGVRAVAYTPPEPEALPSSPGLTGSASRGTSRGLLLAATELLLLARADAIVRTGSRGYSSYSYVAAGARHRPTGPPPQYLVVHPCDEHERWPKEIDCVREHHTQPRLNMYWHPVDNAAERGRAACELRAPDGRNQTLSQRLQARGAMDLQCQDLAAMHAWEQSEGTLLKLPAKPAGKRDAKQEL